MSEFANHHCKRLFSNAALPYQGIKTHHSKPLTLANASSCFAIPQIRFRFHILMLLLHSLRYMNHGIFVSISSCLIPPAPHWFTHHSISSRPCISWRTFFVVVELRAKGPAGRYHGSSSMRRRRAMGFACGRMVEQSFLQVVSRAYVDLMGRNSQVERRMSGGRDVNVSREFRKVGSV